MEKLEAKSQTKGGDTMGGLAYGLDFGTTHSVISVLDDSGHATVLPVGGSGQRTVRSVLFFPYDSPEKTLIGQEAIDSYLIAGERGRFLQSVKSALTDDKFTGTLINGRKHSIEDLVSYIISFLKAKADDIIGHNVENVVLGRPAIFSNDPQKEQLARERLVTAAQKAGFKEVRFQLEPIAAAFHYESTLAKPETVLVVDLGGGTSDFTLMRLSPEKRLSTERNGDIIGTSGIYIGGDNFDARIMWSKVVKYFGSEVNYKSGSKMLQVPHRIIGAITDWRRLSFIREDRYEQETIQLIMRTADDQEPILRLQSLINDDLGFFLAQSVEQAKCQLSNHQQTEIVFERNDISINEPIRHTEFEESVQGELSKIEGCLDKLLLSSGTEAPQIDTVFLTGGTSYVPSVRGLFEEKMGAGRVVQGDAFLSVASGLALSSKLFF